MAEKGRFAPSPSGRMHLGNLFSFYVAWLDARSVGGKVVLRMEDLDPDRTGERWIGHIVEDLRWLGLDWNEGYGVGGPDGPYCQRERTALYDAAFEQLRAQEAVYPCWCSRAQRLAASAPHPGEERDLGHCPCRDLSRAEREARAMVKAPAWKVALPHEAVRFRDLIQGEQAFDLARDCGDFVIRRADGVYGYQLAVTVDDALMGVTRVVRGRDLLDSAARQIWLMEQLGYHAPVYAHVPLLLAPDGRRLSKRERDLDMGALRERFSPGSLHQLLWNLLPLSDHRVEGQDFSIDKVGKEDIYIEILE
ncbi:tRNA glutamyl-Q(34) synthetase GluQRS [Intestinimonas sp. HCP28S3_D6]|uniref:tRNA glutamyl-Q(34) synthetase GluQRS n=1 Tax=Intestinimonas sp. HCP28S3_D6 TaxID=3438942 RepID=UPI003F8CEC9A